MYKNNNFFIPYMDKKIKSNIKINKKMKTKKQIIINPKLNRLFYFLAGCIHIVIFVLIYVYIIKDLLNMKKDIDEAVPFLIFGIGFMVGGLFCFGNFILHNKGKANIITVDIGIFLVALSVWGLFWMLADKWVNSSTGDDDDYLGTVACALVVWFGVLMIKGGLKGKKPKEAFKSLDDNDSGRNDKKTDLNNYIKSYENDYDMYPLYEINDDMDFKSEDDISYIDEKDNNEKEEDKEGNKQNKKREIIYKALLNNKPNENNFY